MTSLSLGLGLTSLPVLSGLSPEVAAAYARLPNLTAAESAAVANFITAEVAAGNYDNTDEYFIFALTDDTDSLTGLKAYSVTDSTLCTNRAADGWSNDSGSKKLVTDIVPSGLTHYQRDNALITGWFPVINDTSGTATVDLCGSDDGTPAIRVRWRPADSGYGVGIQQNSPDPAVATVSGAAETKALMQWGRAAASGAGAVVQYRDGITDGIGTSTSTAVPDSPMVILGFNNAGSPLGPGTADNYCAFWSIGNYSNIDLKAQARNVRNLLRALGTTGAKHITVDEPTVLIGDSGYTWEDAYVPASLTELPSGTPEAIEGDTVTTSVAFNQTPPAGMASALTGLDVTDVMKITVRSSGNTGYYKARLDFDFPETVFTDSDKANFGLAFYLADSEVYAKASSPTWVRTKQQVTQIYITQDTGYSLGSYAQVQPNASVFNRPGWSFIKMHVDNQSLKDIDYPLGDDATLGGYERVRFVLPGWNSAAYSPQPVAGEAMVYYIAAFTKLGHSTPCVLFNYDHHREVNRLNAWPSHEEFKVPGTFSGPASVWNPDGLSSSIPADSGSPIGPENPINGGHTVSDAIADLATNDADLQLTHHYGSGEYAAVASPADSDYNHPDVRDYAANYPGRIKQDYDKNVSLHMEYFPTQPAAYYKTLSYAHGHMTQAALDEITAAGQVLGRGTWPHEGHSYPQTVSWASGAARNGWIFNYPDLLVDPLQLNAINMEDNTGDAQQLIQHAIAHIDAVIARGGTLNLWQHDSEASSNTATISGHNGGTAAGTLVINSVAHGFEDGDRILIYGVNGEGGGEPYNWADVIAQNTPDPTAVTGINYGHFIVANKTADTFEIEDPENTGTSLSGDNMTAFSTSGTAALVTPLEGDTTAETTRAVLDYIRAKINSGDLVALTFYDWAHDLGLV